MAQRNPPLAICTMPASRWSRLFAASIVDSNIEIAFETLDDVSFEKDGRVFQLLQTDP